MAIWAPRLTCLSFGSMFANAAFRGVTKGIFMQQFGSSCDSNRFDVWLAQTGGDESCFEAKGLQLEVRAELLCFVSERWSLDAALRSDKAQLIDAIANTLLLSSTIVSANGAVVLRMIDLMNAFLRCSNGRGRRQRRRR